MIKSITITNDLDESVRLVLTDPEESGFAVKSITGLGPVKANVNFTSMATIDGSIDNSARLESRNIVISLVFLAHPTIEDTRLLSYKYFPVKKKITFMVETDNRSCETVGRVESNEPDIFSDKEGCQISIMCPDPYFYSTEENKTTFYGVDPLFEFPFSNESLNENLIEFGAIISKTEETIFYNGDSEVGITIVIHAVGEVVGLTIYNITTREVMGIDDKKLVDLLGSGIKAGDEITISTSRGSKSITLIRNGIAINILNVLNRPIQWFQLVRGENIFAYTAEEGVSNLQFRIQNKVVYKGV